VVGIRLQVHLLWIYLYSRSIIRTIIIHPVLRSGGARLLPAMAMPRWRRRLPWWRWSEVAVVAGCFWPAILLLAAAEPKKPRRSERLDEWSPPAEWGGMSPGDEDGEDGALRLPASASAPVATGWVRAPSPPCHAPAIYDRHMRGMGDAPAPPPPPLLHLGGD
jgi:hypothetical protein